MASEISVKCSEIYIIIYIYIYIYICFIQVLCYSTHAVGGKK